MSQEEKYLWLFTGGGTQAKEPEESSREGLEGSVWAKCSRRWPLVCPHGSHWPGTYYMQHFRTILSLSFLFTWWYWWFCPHQEPSKSIQLDQLGQKLMDKIGSSWSKRFRKHYGPIGKVCLASLFSSYFSFNHVDFLSVPNDGLSLWMQFLQSHSDVFMLVSNGTRVALKANPPSPVTDSPGSREQAAHSDPSSPSDPAATEPQQSKQEVQGRWQNLLRVHKFKSNPEGLSWTKEEGHNSFLPPLSCGRSFFDAFFSRSVFLSVSRVATGSTLMTPRWPPSGNLISRSSSKAKRVLTCCSTEKHSCTGPGKVIGSSCYISIF